MSSVEHEILQRAFIHVADKFDLILDTAPVQTFCHGDSKADWNRFGEILDVQAVPGISLHSPSMYKYTDPLISRGKPRVEFTISGWRRKKLLTVDDRPGSSEEKAATNTA